MFCLVHKTKKKTTGALKNIWCMLPFVISLPIGCGSVIDPKQIKFNKLISSGYVTGGKSEIISCGALTVLLAQQAVNLICDIVWICFSAILSFRVWALTCLRICIATHKSYQRPVHSARVISEDICKKKTPLLIVDQTRPITQYQQFIWHLREVRDNFPP